MAEGFTPAEDYTPADEYYDEYGQTKDENTEMKKFDNWEQTPDGFVKPPEEDTSFVEDLPDAPGTPVSLEIRLTQAKNRNKFLSLRSLASMYGEGGVSFVRDVLGIKAKPPEIPPLQRKELNKITETRAVLGFRGLWVSRFVEHVVVVTGGTWNVLVVVCVWVVMTGWSLSRTMKVDRVQRHIGCKTNKEMKHMFFVGCSNLIIVYLKVL